MGQRKQRLLCRRLLLLATLKRLPIGYTKEDSPTFIIDEEGNKLPNGEQGEIIVSGPAVSKGYMNNPEKTAEAFFEFEGLPAYHTGDVGTMTDEGLLLYGGRMDFQIKFNGYRIELEDVSQNLNKSQYIDSAGSKSLGLCHLKRWGQGTI